MKTWILVFCAIFVTGAQAANYKYSDLIIKNYDEMNAEVQARIKKSRALTPKDTDDNTADHAAVEELRDALKLIFSRPNSDNMVAKLAPEVRRELTAFSAYEDTISSLAAEEIGLAKEESGTVAQRSTALFVLENILSEIRPESARNADLRRVVQRIAEAKLKVAPDVIKDRKLRSMFKTRNPSDMADEILKSLPKEEPVKH